MTPAEIIATWVPTDTLIHRLTRQATATGTAWEDLDRHLADELGVTLTDWHGYHTVQRAADRYQTDRYPTPDPRPRLPSPHPHPRPDHPEQARSACRLTRHAGPHELYGEPVGMSAAGDRVRGRPVVRAAGRSVCTGHPELPS